MSIIPEKSSMNTQNGNKGENSGSDHAAIQHPRELLYTSLGASEIRLVEILPGTFLDPIYINIKSVDLQDNPTYDALSYVWNPKDASVKTDGTSNYVAVRNADNLVQKIGINLGTAIRYLRKKQTGRMVWIDALSINQESLGERNHQVGLMNRVYSSAKQVVIWLGPPHDDSEFAMNALITGHLVQMEIPRFINSLEWLLRRDWFGRLWIAQELALARESPIMHHGYQTIDWDTFSRAIQLVKAKIMGEESVDRTREATYLRDFSKAALDDMISGDGNVVMEPKAVVARADCVQQLVDMRKAGEGARFTEQLFRTIYLKATDPRDKVFGVLGFSTFDCWTITPDYTRSIGQVFAQAAAAIMREDFCTYLRTQLWGYRPGAFDNQDAYATYGEVKDVFEIPSWACNIELMGSLRITDSSVMARTSELEHALTKKCPYALPRVEFSDDFSRLRTIGNPMGRIIASDPISLFHGGSYTPNSCSVRLEMLSQGMDFDLEKVLSALLGPCNPHSFNQDDMLAVWKSIHRERKLETLPPDLMSSDHYLQLEKVLSFHGRDTKLFVTDFGCLGIAQASIDIESCLVAGLFGINLPFVLQDKEPRGGTEMCYQIVSVAHVADHDLVDPHVWFSETEAELEAACVQGVLGFFTIV